MTKDEELSLLREEIGQLKAQLEEAKASNIAKETFLSNMSHDIRTPMNAIVGMTSIARKHIDEKARVADALSKIETASGHLLSLINEVLDMSRIDSGRMKITKERFSLSDLLHDVTTIIQPQMAQKGHSWKLETKDISQEFLIGDMLRLRQVYVNIINNAVKYTPEGGNIVLSVSESEADASSCRLTFSCRDNGIGMSEDFLSRIFEPFERAGSTTVSRIEGTGLGMSIVKKLVDAMDGSIEITSEPGKGTCVTISIPMQSEDVPLNAAALSDKRFLILEADEEMKQLYEEYLGGFGITHNTVSSAAYAVSVLADAEYNQTEYSAVIIGRSNEENSSVFDIASYIKAARPGMPIILISGHNWDEIQYQANRSGITHFIPLPVFRKSLLNGLTTALSSETGNERLAGTPDLKGRRILLVEDNMINMEIAKEILSTTGADIDTAENGALAVEKFKASKENEYSLILMDVQMPVMDGYEATRNIRSLERSDAGTVPIFAMTANNFAEDIAKAREAGMNGHIAKPIDISLLMQTLQNALK